MSPNKKQNKRVRKTPIKLKDGANVIFEGETPKRVRNRDRNTSTDDSEPKSFSETLHEKSNKDKWEYIGNQIDKLVTTVSVLASVLGGSLNKKIPKILSTDDDGEGLEPTRGNGRGEGEGEGEHTGIDNGNLSELLVLTNKNHKYDQVVGELDEVKKTMNDMKLILETFAGKHGQSMGGGDSAVPSSSEEEEGGGTLQTDSNNMIRNLLN